MNGTLTDYIVSNGRTVAAFDDPVEAVRCMPAMARILRVPLRFYPEDGWRFPDPLPTGCFWEEDSESHHSGQKFIAANP